MSRDDEYRRQAAEAQKQADRARTDMDREGWLRVGQGWLSMIRTPAPMVTEAFDGEVAAKRTDDGNTSNTSQ